jgi:hypothetical protein
MDLYGIDHGTLDRGRCAKDEIVIGGEPSAPASSATETI